jgi:hypothetical protein
VDAKFSSLAHIIAEIVKKDNGLVQEPGWFSANQRLASSLSKNHDF